MRLTSRNFRSSAAAIALSAAAFAATPALAEKANLNAMSFSVEAVNATIRVISTDGQKWDKLANGAVGLTADMSIDTKGLGFVGDVGIKLGSCGGNACFSMPSLWYKDIEQRDWSGSAVFGFQTSQLPVSSATGIAINPAADQMIRRCNEHLQADGPTRSYSFAQEMYATFIADTGKTASMNFIHNQPEEVGASGLTEIDHWDSAPFTVNVVCDPVVKSPVSDLKHDFGEFDVENVKLFLTTYQSNQPGSNPGTVCPALKVTSRAQANQAGPVSMRIWRQKDGGPITSDFQQAWASFDPAKNGYFATYETFENVGTTSYFQFKTEIVEPGPFGPFDGWKDITVHCASPGGGGFAPLPPVNPDQPKPQASWDGTVTVADSAGRDKSCPRKGQVSFAVSRQAPGDFQYRISCSNGAYFEGTATGFQQEGNLFAASGAHELSVNRTRSIQCTLQELKNGVTPITVAVDSEDFACANPNFEPAADDVTSSTRPVPAKPEPKRPDPRPEPKRPLVLVQPCAENQIRVDGRCVRKPGVSIHCLPGFVQEGMKCVRKPVIVTACKRTELRIEGKCVKKPEVSILCAPGFELKGKTCVRKPGGSVRPILGKASIVGALCGPNQKPVRGHCVDKPTPSRADAFGAPKRVLNKTVLNTLKFKQVQPARRPVR